MVESPLMYDMYLSFDFPGGDEGSAKTVSVLHIYHPFVQVQRAVLTDNRTTLELESHPLERTTYFPPDNFDPF